MSKCALLISETCYLLSAVCNNPSSPNKTEPPQLKSYFSNPGYGPEHTHVLWVLSAVTLFAFLIDYSRKVKLLKSNIGHNCFLQVLCVFFLNV